VIQGQALAEKRFAALCACIEPRRTNAPDQHSKLLQQAKKLNLGYNAAVQYQRGEPTQPGANGNLAFAIHCPRHSTSKNPTSNNRAQAYGSLRKTRG
jgi:hypothetical protein